MAAVLAGTPASADAVLITPGSVLTIRVEFPDEGFDQENVYRVDGLGFVKHELAGRIRLLNLTTDQAADLLQRTIFQRRGYGETLVRVAFLQRDLSYSISGEIKKPGTYALPADSVTLAEALKAAGGTKPSFKSDLVRVKRKGSTMKHVRPSRQGTFRIKPGDEIIVLP